MAGIPVGRNKRKKKSVWTAYGGGWRREDRGGRGTDGGRGRGTGDGDGLFKDPRIRSGPQSSRGRDRWFFSSLSPLLPAATRMEREKKSFDRDPESDRGRETCQCQDGPSRAYRRGGAATVHWGVWPENPRVTGNNRRQSRVGSTNIGIGNCAWGRRQLVNISGHDDRSMAIGASSPSRGLALAVGLFLFSRPSVDEMQSSSLCKARLFSLSRTCPDHLVRAFAAALLLPPSL